MFVAGKPSRLRHVWSLACVVIAVTLTLPAGAIAAPSRGSSQLAHPSGDRASARTVRQRAIAEHKRADALYFRLTHSRKRPLARIADAGMPFQRGDVFLTGSGNVQEYSASGDLQQTLAGSAGYLCFDRSGHHLILPGVGMFDRSGNLVPSHWASVTTAGRCVADGFDNVYVGALRPSLGWTITKYDIRGNLVQTINVAPLQGIDPLSVDIAPDDCTLYYGSYPADQIGRFNVCTNTQQPPIGGGSFGDDLRVLPNWQILVTHDYAGVLVDASGENVIQTYQSLPLGLIFFRSMSLDPDGTSFWMSGGGTVRYDINSGTLLSTWCNPASAGSICQVGPTVGGPIAVYSPPLLGDANVERTIDSNAAGTAEAFSTTASYSGQLTRQHLWVGSSSAASGAIVGIYSDRLVRPGALLTHGTITNLRAGSWNYVDVAPVPVTKGRRYWIAVLGPSGGGRVSLRDRAAGGLSWTTAQHRLSTLPTQWPVAAFPGLSSALSAYGS